VSFILPGSEAQIVAGGAISFVSFLLYQHMCPHADKSVLRISYFGHLIIFLFFVAGILLKASSRFAPLTNNDTGFFAGVVGVLVIALFSVPLLVLITRAFFRTPLSVRVRRTLRHMNA
jgi:hypothetical protein